MKRLLTRLGWAGAKVKASECGQQAQCDSQFQPGGGNF
jgi:hypothetical protein